MKGKRKKKVAPKQDRKEPNLQPVTQPQITYTKPVVAMLAIVLRNPIVAHPVRISAAVGGEIAESWALRLGQRMEIPDLALKAFDKTAKFLLLLLLLKWVADALIDTWNYFRDRLR